MTTRTRDLLKAAAPWAVVLLSIGAGAWRLSGKIAAIDSKVDITSYQNDRLRDSLNNRYDRREILDSISETNRVVNEIRDCLKAKVCR